MILITFLILILRDKDPFPIAGHIFKAILVINTLFNFVEMMM